MDDYKTLWISNLQKMEILCCKLVSFFLSVSFTVLVKQTNRLWNP